jgi:hypothetical protein
MELVDNSVAELGKVGTDEESGLQSEIGANWRRVVNVYRGPFRDFSFAFGKEKWTAYTFTKKV